MKKSYILILAIVAICITLFSAIYIMDIGNVRFQLTGASEHMVRISEEEYKIDLVNSKGSFIKLCEKGFGYFAALYKKEGITNPFNNTQTVFMKDFQFNTFNNSNIIDYMYFRIMFTYNNKIYIQSFTYQQGIMTSYIDSASELNSAGFPVDMEGYTTPVYEFLRKMDNVDFMFFLDLEPDAKQYALDYIGDSNIFHKNEGECKRYLLNADGSMKYGNMDENEPIGRSVPVAYLYYLKETKANTYESYDGYGLYINK